MKTYVVTGGAGFIGSHVTEALLKQGHKVIIIDHMNDFYDPAVKEKNLQEIKVWCKKNGSEGQLLFKKADIRDEVQLQAIFAGADIAAIIHLAAYAGVRPSIENPKLYYDVNVMGTLNVLEIARENGVKKVVFASSSSVYGNTKTVPFKESDFVDRPISPYAATKKSGELLCHTYHHLHQMDIACLRFFTVYGPRQRPDLAIHKFTKKISAGEKIPFFGDGSTKRDYTYIQDIVDGVTKALQWVEAGEDRFEVFNLVESATISLSQMVETIERAVGKTALLERLPNQPGDVKLTNAAIDKAKTMLGYQPKTEFADGIEKFVAWFKKNKQ